MIMCVVDICSADLDRDDVLWCRDPGSLLIIPDHFVMGRGHITTNIALCECAS